jgi:putative MATE family efflux protein
VKKDMTVGKEWKLILLFTLPIMAGNFLQQLYNTVDGIVVGHFVGQDAFAGVGTCTPLTFLVLAMATGISVGIGVTISQYFGAKKYDELAVAVDTSLILMGIVSLIITALGFVFTPFLLKHVLGTPDNIMPYAVTYFRIYCLGLFFQFIYNAIAFILRGIGDSKATLYFLLITTVVNTVLDLAAVVWLGMGVTGTAVATVISQVVCAVVSYIYMRKRFPYMKGGRHFDIPLCKTVLRLGIPSAIQQSIVALGNTAMQRLVNSFGESCIAAYAASGRISNYMFVPIIGFQSGLANFTGQNIGAGMLDRVKRGLRSTMLMGVLVTVVLSILIFVFAGPVVYIFGVSGESMQYGIIQLRFVSVAFIIFSVYMIYGGVLQGAGDIMLQSVATLTALTLRIILGYAGVAVGILGYNAAWVTLPIGWVAALVITLIRYYSGKWKTKAVAGTYHDQPAVAEEKQPAEQIAE